MRNFLKFESAQRRTKSTDGITNVTMISVNKAGETSTTIGTIVRASGANEFRPVTTDNEDLGGFDTRNLAAGVLKRTFQKNGEPTANSVTLEAAAKVLCPNAKNQVSALKKKIARGSIKTVTVGGELRVVL